jgi:hypothetical protein
MMIMLPSSGGLRRPQLRSPNILRAISSSREVSGAAYASSKDISTTENPSKVSPCSYIRDGDPWDETIGEEVRGGVDRVGNEGGVGVSLDEEEDELA